MSVPEVMGRPEEVANKVLRRAQVSKMARTLQDRLALASVKVKHGWQHRSLVTIEPEIERELKRKRVESNIDMFSDTSSVASTGHCFSTGAPASSPLTAPLFSDDLIRSGSSARDTYNKRFRNDIPVLEPPGSSHSTHSQGGRGRTSKRKTTSWKSKYELPQSSPTHYRSRTRPTLANDRHGSFISEQSTILHSPSASEDDDQDLPLPTFRAPVLPRNLSSVATPHLQSSPPRTPSPSRSPHLRTQESIDAGKEGADLLLYLAASPSPAIPINKLAYPSTPDPPSHPLPSSHMTTPGLNVWDKFQPITPGTAGFNFGEFCNISPSPAQQAWRRTPAGAAAYGRTPRVQLEARRRLDFDGEVPVASRSPTIAKSSQGSVGTGSWSVKQLEVGPEMEVVKRSFGSNA